MTTGRKVDAAPLCRRAPDLFCNGDEAWAHLVRHVLDARESWSWGVLVPALKAALDAGRRADLHERARGGSPVKVPAELKAIWPAFLDRVAAAVEQATKQGWYWEEDAGGEDGPYRAFAATGILAYLDDDVVRTGFLPFRDDLPPGGVTEADRRYRLFLGCWRKVRFKYQRAGQGGRLVRAPAALQALMLKVLDRAAWDRLP